MSDYEEGPEQTIEYNLSSLKAEYLSTEMLDDLNELHSHHPESAEHSDRVGILLYELIKNQEIDLGFTEEQKKQLVQVGFIHDVGKLEIDPNILSNIRKLPKKEKMKILHEHAEAGYDRIKNRYRREDLANIEIAHHEYQPET